MLKVQRLIITSLVMAISISLVACKKGPALITFQNFKYSDYANTYLDNQAMTMVREGKKKYFDLFSNCENGITKKPGFMLSSDLKRKLGAPRATIQLINEATGSVVDKWEGDANPDMTSIKLPWNLPAKGSYLINLIVKDEIIAQGKIKYE